MFNSLKNFGALQILNYLPTHTSTTFSEKKRAKGRKKPASSKTEKKDLQWYNFFSFQIMVFAIVLLTWGLKY